MERLLRTGKARAIGVSNFSKAEMERLLRETSVVPAVHQMECHLWLQQPQFTAWHRERGIHVTHYLPLGKQKMKHGARVGGVRLIEQSMLARIARSYGKYAAQVALGTRPDESVPLPPALLKALMWTISDTWIDYSLGSHAGSLCPSKVQDISPGPLEPRIGF